MVWKGKIVSRIAAKKCLVGDNGSITGLAHLNNVLTWLATMNRPPHPPLASLLTCVACFTRILKEEKRYVKTRFYFISTSQGLMDVPAHFVDDAHMSRFRKREELLSPKIYPPQRKKKQIKRSKNKFYLISISPVSSQLIFTFIASFNNKVLF